MGVPLPGCSLEPAGPPRVQADRVGLALPQLLRVLLHEDRDLRLSDPAVRHCDDELCDLVLVRLEPQVVQTEERDAAARPARLFPSTKGWFLTMWKR